MKQDFWKTLFENDEGLIRLGNDREYMICEVNEIWVLMFYGEDHPEKQFITLNDAVKWVVNRMVETEKNTKFLSAYWSKLKYQDENDQINWDESVYDFLKGVNKQ